jgi:formylglycine-generating enzyme required for sulfatase activity
VLRAEKRRGAAVVAALAGLLPGCSDEAPPRAQLVVVVDTDAPLPFHTLENEAISLDAMVDTLRVDVLDPDDPSNKLDSRDFVAPDPADWPISFGVPRAGKAIDRSLLRLRLFRAALAAPGTVEGERQLEPLREASIDRVAAIPLPDDGVRRVRVALSFDCFGAGPSFVGEPTTCIDGGLDLAPATDGVSDDDGSPTKVGTSTTPHEVPCTGAPEGTVCIPGGFTLMGDAALVGMSEESADCAPMRPVRVRPFAIDKREFTVARFRALAPTIQGELPEEAHPTRESCVWTAAPGPYETRALNCVDPDTAAEACALSGGLLPSEAQWEHAARGRGRGTRFPWGDVFPGCCVASFGGASGCGLSRPEPGGSHPRTDACSLEGDVSLDGVDDMGGNVGEITRDGFAEYADPCWSARGIQQDPVCDDAAASLNTVRGGDWLNGSLHLLAALRRSTASAGVSYGFRCVYEVAP